MTVSDDLRILWGKLLPKVLQVLPDYIALLEYGSGVLGERRATSDLDLLIVTEKSYQPSRFHLPRLDLNVLSIDAIERLERRLLINEERPWDGMFASVRVVDSRSSRVTQLVERIDCAFGTRVPTPDDVAGLRFLFPRMIEDCADAEGSLEQLLTSGQLLALCLYVHSTLKGERWRGVRATLRLLATQDKHLTELLTRTFSGRRVSPSAIRVIERHLFRDFDGPWSAGVLKLRGGFDDEHVKTARHLNATAVGKLESICESLEAVLANQAA